jgi:hypothetical protein
VRTFRILFLIVVMGFVGLSTGAAADPATVAAALRPTAAVTAVTEAAAAVAAPVAAPVPAAPVAPARAAGTPCSATARACVDLSSKQAWLIANGVVEYGPVPIATGRSGYRTPPGTFKVTFKSRHHVSSIYGSRMPYSVFFNRGIAFHQGDLGSGSHGCVRLSRAAAQTFFASLSPGDVVQVVR